MNDNKVAQETMTEKVSINTASTARHIVQYTAQRKHAVQRVQLES
jgi:hypothetical protein